MTRFAFVTGHVFGRRALEGLLSCDAAVDGKLSCALVIGLSEERSAETVGFDTLRGFSEAHQVQFAQTHNGTLVECADALKQIAPHYIVVVGWSRLVASSVLDLPRRAWGSAEAPRNGPSFGCIGMHPTRLPEGRGQAPLPWTIIKGCERSALTTFFLEEEADAGAIIRQQEFGLRKLESASVLFHRVADLHFHAGVALGAELASRNVMSVPQSEELVSVWPRRDPVDSRLTDFGDAGAMERTVRALTWPYPSAYLLIDGESIRVAAAKAIGTTPLRATNGEVICCADGYLDVAVGGVVVRLDVDIRDRQRLGDPAAVVGRALGGQ